MTAEDDEALDGYRQNFSRYLSFSLTLFVVYEQFWKRLLHYLFFSRTEGEEGGGGLNRIEKPQTNYFTQESTASY